MRTVKEEKKQSITIYYSLIDTNINQGLRRGWFTRLTIVENDKITGYGKFYFKFSDPFFNSLKESIKELFSLYDVKIYKDNTSNHRKIKNLKHNFKDYELTGEIDYESLD